MERSQVAPTVSVIIPSYNHEQYVAETLRSLEAQSFQDFEIIVVDDGSTDRTVEVIKDTFSRAQLHTQPNRGVVAARNRGVSLSQGKYLCFVDSDDVLMPQCLQRQVAVLEADPQVVLTFADAVIIDADGARLGLFSDVYPVVPGDTAEMLVLHYCFTPMVTVMVRADVFRQTGRFRYWGPISDYIKWIEVAAAGKTYYDPTPLGSWRRHAESTSKQGDKERSYAVTRIALRRVLNRCPQLRARIGDRIKRRYARSYFLTGFFLAADGNVPRARRYYCKAIKTWPGLLEGYGGLAITCLLPQRPAAAIHRRIKRRRLPW